MSNSLNKVMLIGRLGKNPEIRHTSGDKAVASFSLATDESYKKDGEKVKKTEWHNIVSWVSVPFIEEYLHSGDLIYVEGKLQTRSWEPKDGGATRYTTEINVMDIRPLSTGGGQDNNKPAAASKMKAAATTKPAAEAAPEIRDEDIPF